MELNLKGKNKGWFKKGQVSPRKGIKLSEETRGKIRETNIKKGIKPPTIYGRIPWNKGMKGQYHCQPNRGKSKGYINTHGYLVFYRNGKEILAHREIWEQYHGNIPKGFEIHHKDDNKLNNDISNLTLLTKSQHAKIHYKQRRKNGFGNKR